MKPLQRVYDEADVLTASEEEKLEELIAKREKQIGCDIVLVTINESILDGKEDVGKNWENGMMNYADDFYDENKFGYDKVHGDGVLLLDNWYEGEKGSWLSTCGRVYKKFSTRMIDDVIDDVFKQVEKSPYKAYCAYINDIYKEMSSGAKAGLHPLVLFLIAVVAAVIFVFTHLKGKIGEKTTNSSTYVQEGSVKFLVKNDTLVNKFVTSRVIPKNTGGSSGSSGGGGGHTSSGGVSHGGGGGRR